MARKLSDEIAVSVPANSLVENVFNGRQLQTAPFPALASFYGTGSAAGLEIQITVGGQLAVARRPLNTNNRSPQPLDDIIAAEIEADRGELVQVTVFNTTAGALTARVRQDVEEAEVMYV